MSLTDPRRPPQAPNEVSARIEGDGVNFLKQYGAQRTGTNLLRVLLAENFRDVVVLMHILGDKHSPPVAFDQLWEQAANTPDPAWEFVRSATWEAPAATTRPGAKEQVEYLREVAGPLAAAVSSGRLGFLISVKDPYAWAVSMLRWLGWLRSRITRVGQEQAICASLQAACQTFNRNYATWLALHDRFPERTSIVRYEDVAKDPATTVISLAKRHGLKRRGNDPTFVRGMVLPTYWDNVPTRAHWVPFEPAHYESHPDLRSLLPVVRGVVTDSIDWVLMARFGYEALR